MRRALFLSCAIVLAEQSELAAQVGPDPTDLAVAYCLGVQPRAART